MKQIKKDLSIPTSFNSLKQMMRQTYHALHFTIGCSLAISADYFILQPLFVFYHFLAKYASGYKPKSCCKDKFYHDSKEFFKIIVFNQDTIS